MKDFKDQQRFENRKGREAREQEMQSERDASIDSEGDRGWVEMAEYSKTVISLDFQKSAFLYFDHVIPVSYLSGLNILGRRTLLFPYSFTNMVDYQKEHPVLLESPSLGLRKLERLTQCGPSPGDALPPELRDNPAFLDCLGRLIDLFSYKRRCAELHQPEYEARKASGDEPDLGPFVPDDVKLGFVRDFINRFLLHSAAVDAPPELFIDKAGASTPDLSVTLSSAHLVDVESTPWEHILEFRSDPEAKRKLRRFRLFAYENYAGRSKAYVEDDILAKLDDYAETAKGWGFKTNVAALTSLFNSDLVKAGLAGSFAAALFNQPLIGISSLVGTAGVALGTVAVEIGKQSFAMREAMEENPVSYIAYAKEKLVSPPQKKKRPVRKIARRAG